jgi:hypothetical protein
LYLAASVRTMGGAEGIQNAGRRSCDGPGGLLLAMPTSGEGLGRGVRTHATGTHAAGPSDRYGSGRGMFPGYGVAAMLPQQYPARMAQSGQIEEIIRFQGFGWCRVQDLNPRPSVYKTAALPLC